MDRYVEFVKTEEQIEQENRFKTVKADVFIATYSTKKKPAQTMEAFRRQQRNYKKALKVRLKGGPEAYVLLDTHTMRVV